MFVATFLKTAMQDRYAGDIGDFGKFGLSRESGMCTPPSPPYQPTCKSAEPHKRGEATMATSSTAAPNPLQIGFWREKEDFGCFSNWYPAGFDFRDTHFSTSEHWMMWQKAQLMGDHSMAALILAAPTPQTLAAE